ncbi:MAG: DMT family transporter [Sphaerochaetaceae bacterium]
MDKRKTLAHTVASITILVWGTTFIATKLLLETFNPLEILIIRFVMGFIGLSLYDAIVNRNSRPPLSLRQELLFAAAGLCGVVIYYFLENVALTMTSASNVGIIVSIAPLTTALVGLFFLKEEKFKIALLIGFLIASLGVALVMFNGQIEFQVSLGGDLLSLAATFGWAVYSILLRKIDTKNYKVATYTKKIFFYGIIWMLPISLFSGFSVSAADFTFRNIALLIFLGLGASAGCFVSWNFAVSVLGVYKTSGYIYLTPLITLFTAALVLKEPITIMALGGCFLIFLGLYLSKKGGPGTSDISDGLAS